MTTEKAIELLNRISDSQFDGPHGDERREALEMAVKALESNLVQESGDLVQDLVKDCIGRQVVAKWLERWDGYVDKDIIERMKLRVIDIPSAHPTYTDEEIQKMQDLESAEIEKAYQLGYEEGKKDAQPTQTNADSTQTNALDCVSRQMAIDAVDSETVSTNPEHFKSSEKFIKFMDDADIASFGKWQWANWFNTALVATKVQLEKLPSAQPELLEHEAYIRGFEQGRTQGMIDAKEGKK